MEFGKAEWIKLCQQTGSPVNILDQRYAVICESIHEEPIMSMSDSDEDREFFALHNVTKRTRKFYNLKMSTFIYSLAIFDCRSAINAEICKRRADIMRSREDAAALRSKRDLVSATALSSKPEEVLSKRFESMEKRHNNSDKRLDALEASHGPPTRGLTASSHRDDDEVLRRLKRLEALTSTRQHPEVAVSRKNLSWADPAELQMSTQAQKKARKAAEKTTCRGENYPTNDPNYDCHYRSIPAAGRLTKRKRAWIEDPTTEQQHKRKTRTRCRQRRRGDGLRLDGSSSPSQSVAWARWTMRTWRRTSRPGTGIAAGDGLAFCKFYVIWKLHKKANAQGVRSRPISSNIG